MRRYLDYGPHPNQPQRGSRPEGSVIRGRCPRTAVQHVGPDRLKRRPCGWGVIAGIPAAGRVRWLCPLPAFPFLPGRFRTAIQPSAHAPGIVGQRARLSADQLVPAASASATVQVASLLIPLMTAAPRRRTRTDRPSASRSAIALLAQSATHGGTSRGKGVDQHEGLVPRRARCASVRTEAGCLRGESPATYSPSVGRGDGGDGARRDLAPGERYRRPVRT